jgi:hypothetical protein
MIEDTPEVCMRFVRDGMFGADWQGALVGGICRGVIPTGTLHMRQIAKGI